MREGWHPGSLLSTSSAYWQGCTLQAAVRLEFFTFLAEAPMTAEEVAIAAQSDVDATGLLLDALSAMKLLEKQGKSYRNSVAAAQFLVKDSPDYMGHIILHHHHLLDGWAQLDQAVKTGGPIEKRSYGEAAERESFLLGMYNLAMQVAPAVAEEIDLSGRKQLLDLGGGPGTYAIHFCKANPGLNAVIFDKASTEPFARSTVDRHQMSERIAFYPGDFNHDPIGGGPYDVAWLSHVLHSNSMERCRRLITEVVAAMTPGGLILVHDFILDDNKDGPEFPALFSLNMLLAHNGGRSYSRKEIMAMLEDAGVEKGEHHPFRAKNDSSIVYGFTRGR